MGVADTPEAADGAKVRPCEWMRMKAFWHVGLNYMCTRLVANVSQVYIVFYIVDVLRLPTTSRASVPLTVFVASFAATTPQKRLFKRLGRTRAYVVGAVFGLAATAGFFLLRAESAHCVYAVAVLLGFANATLMVSSVSLEADLVGDHVASGAFIYGAMSLTDKLSNGAAVMVIQNVRHKLRVRGISDATLLRDVMSLGLGAVVVVALVGLVFLPKLEGKAEEEVEEGGNCE